MIPLKSGLQNVLAVSILYHEKYYVIDNICKTKIKNIMFCVYNIKVLLFSNSFISWLMNHLRFNMEKLSHTHSNHTPNFSSYV